MLKKKSILIISLLVIVTVFASCKYDDYYTDQEADLSTYPPTVYPDRSLRYTVDSEGRGDINDPYRGYEDRLREFNEERDADYSDSGRYSYGYNDEYGYAYERNGASEARYYPGGTIGTDTAGYAYRDARYSQYAYDNYDRYGDARYATDSYGPSDGARRAYQDQLNRYYFESPEFANDRGYVDESAYIYNRQPITVEVSYPKEETTIVQNENNNNFNVTVIIDNSGRNTIPIAVDTRDTTAIRTDNVIDNNERVPITINNDNRADASSHSASRADSIVEDRDYIKVDSEQVSENKNVNPTNVDIETIKETAIKNVIS